MKSIQKHDKWTPLDLNLRDGSWYEARCAVIDWRGKAHLLNLVRPVTFWRRVRTWFGLHDPDDMIVNSECRRMVLIDRLLGDARRLPKLK